MEYLGIDIKELKRRKSKAVVIVRGVTSIYEYHSHCCSKLTIECHCINSLVSLIHSRQDSNTNARTQVHNKEDATGFIAKSESCCHIFNKDDVVTEKCVMIVTSYAKFMTMRETLEGFTQVVVFLDSNPIKSVKDLKKFSLCLNREKKTAVLLTNTTKQTEQFVSWLEGMYNQKITNLKIPCNSLEDLLKSSSSDFNDTIDRIKSPSMFVLSLLRRLSFATESYPRESSKCRLEVPLCVEVSSETLSLFLRLARSLYVVFFVSVDTNAQMLRKL